MVAGLPNRIAGHVVPILYYIQYYFCIATSCTVFVFRICTLFDKFKYATLLNFQTIVTGLRNSTARHVVLILYHILLCNSVF